MDSTQPTGPTSGRQRPDLTQLGRTSWAIVGVALAAVAVFLAARYLSGITVPLVAALIVAVLALPATDWLAPRMRRGPAVAVVLLVLAVLGAGVCWVFVKGLAQQSHAIASNLSDAGQQLQQWLGDNAAGNAASGAADAASSAVTNVQVLTGWLASGIGALTSLLMGLFIAAMVLFLVLLDPADARGWVASALPWDQAKIDRMLRTAGQVIRDYYKGATILALVNAVPVWLAALGLGIEGAGAVLVVLFVTSYIPYIGAWLGGAFAVLMALGSGGTSTAVVMLIVVLVVNLGLQSVVQPFAYSATLKVSALGVFVVTLLGGLVAGAFGAMLAGPIMAFAGRYDSDVRRSPEPTAAPTPSP